MPPWMGTCYFAREPVGCLLEVFREGALISEFQLEALRISRLLLPFEANLADCTSGLSRAFGVTAEIHSTPDYSLPQAWAAALAEAGFHGIHHYLRHDPEQRLTGIALFGPAGVGTPASGFIHEPARPIGLEILKEARRRFGMVVVPTY